MDGGAHAGRTVIQAAVRRWQAWRGRAPGEKACAEGAARRLADAVLARADVVSARDQVHRDMLRMMGYFGVEPGRIPARFQDALHDAEQGCARCLAVGRCQRWAVGRAGEDAPRAFCPNAELYEEIAASQRRTPATSEPSGRR